MLVIRKPLALPTLKKWFNDNKHGEALDWEFHRNGDYHELAIVPDIGNSKTYYYGTVIGMFRYLYKDDKECGLAAVLIGKPYRNKGYCRQMMNILKAEYQTIYLYCNSHNLEVYLNLGFKEYDCESKAYHYMVWHKDLKI